MQKVLGRWIQFVDSQKKGEYILFMEGKMGQDLLRKQIWLRIEKLKGPEIGLLDFFSFFFFIKKRGGGPGTVT